MIRPIPSPGPTRFECETCGRHDTSDRDLPEGWELRAAGPLHVQICGYCIPAWEGRPRRTGFSAANDQQTTLVVQNEPPRAWIAVDPHIAANELAAIVSVRAMTRSWHVNPGVKITHWPMPELGGAAILFTGDHGEDGVLFTADRASLADLVAQISRIGEGLGQ